MLRVLRILWTYTIKVIDGEIGLLKDVYVDDRDWKVRYIVANTTRWLPGRQVLISPHAVGLPDWKSENIPVNLTKDQIINSPSIEDDKPISLEQENALTKYYQWPGPGEDGENQDNNSHLQSIAEIMDNTLHATNGECGRIVNYIVDADSWIIRYLVIETGEWLVSKRVLAAASWVTHINRLDRHLNVDLTQEQIRDCPEYDPSAPINRVLETQIYDYYGRPCS